MMIKQAEFQFRGNLNDFLSSNKRKQKILSHFRGRQSVKHLVESLGVPHTEIGAIQVNSEEVSPSYLVKDGDSVIVHEIMHYDANWMAAWPKSWHGIPKFLLDNHLGKLAIYLRILGFDAYYRNDFQDEQLAQIASEKNHMLLTRDRGLLMRNEVLFGYCIREKDPKLQIVEVINRFNLYEKIQPFQRCLRCNYPLREIEKSKIIDRLQPLTKKYYRKFHICDRCDQIYWKGSHYEHMHENLEKLMIYYANSHEQTEAEINNEQ